MAEERPEWVIDPEAVLTALRLAAADAKAKHKALGFPMAVWRDGKVVWIPPEEL